MIERKPDWLRIKVRGGSNLKQVQRILRQLSLNTVCEEANCPNRLECFSQKTATFIIMGNQCSRNCRFCNVSHGALEPLDPQEPEKVAAAAAELALKHVVITSVTRDDLHDGGASHFARVVAAIGQRDPSMAIEVLIPDFQGDKAALKTVIDARPAVINHNIETVPRLYQAVRPMASYERSLQLLAAVKDDSTHIFTKSGIMVGLGETVEEVHQVMADLRRMGCDFITIGQYLAPSKNHYPIQAYVTPEQFKSYEEAAYQMGFLHVASGPLVRSSYHAAEALG